MGAAPLNEALNVPNGQDNDPRCLGCVTGADADQASAAVPSLLDLDAPCQGQSSHENVLDVLKTHQAP